MRAFPLEWLLYCAVTLHLSHGILPPIGCPPRVGSSQDENSTLKLRELPNQLFNPVFSVSSGDLTILPLIWVHGAVFLSRRAWSWFRPSGRFF